VRARESTAQIGDEREKRRGRHHQLDDRLGDRGRFGDRGLEALGVAFLEPSDVGLDAAVTAAGMFCRYASSRSDQTRVGELGVATTSR